ncbi:MAG: chorismate-binding protein [Vicingus serpentipes]|nr:chorismate-binding protein [Vicingus serpentipes]
MNKINITTQTKKLLSDTVTPVGLYLKLRDKFHNSFLLESSDYHANNDNFSYICLEPIVSFIVENHNINISGLGMDEKIQIKERSQVISRLQELISTFKIETKGIVNGFFGYTGYDAVKYFETVDIKAKKVEKYTSPEMHYSLFRYIIQIDHFKNELLIIENVVEGVESNLEELTKLVSSSKHPHYTFKVKGKEESNVTDSEFRNMVAKGKEHCQKGDVFQIVLSRQFSQQFSGDEFNVYRALRSVNPSPYSFYFDFGNFKLFGSSPEAQLKAHHGKATINPIAGTFKRTGDVAKDKLVAEKLAKDPKENAEHTMLVDLARNDLSRHGRNVTVKTYKETQFYSHVIHLVSEVEADLNTQSDALQVFADTFPAGTLSGAPKYKAMQLIDQYENQNRGFYGGAIEVFGFDGSLKHAITIRRFLSKNNTLLFQAGAGVVVSSIEENELQEVNNKLGALKQALNLAENI